jgi:FAD-dependent urate hydroxylase
MRNVASCDVAVVGAGPYGLATATHLRSAAGLDVRVFGQPMSFWERQMPEGMLLRSPWEGSHISDPHDAYTLDRYRAQSREPFSSPVPLPRFVDYGRWYQRNAVPDVDPRLVRLLDAFDGGFRLELEDGETVAARRAVVAAGIGEFAWRPPEYAGLPPTHVSHSIDHRDLSPFAGRRVMVVGGGQSALEYAALLHEVGAEVEVLVRNAQVHWLTRRWHHRIPVVSRCMYAPPDVGPAFVSWLVALPQLFRRLPRELQNRLSRRSLRPAGAAWLVPRLCGVPITTEHPIVEAATTNGHVRLRLDGGADRVADHVLLATGYRVDVARYRFLAPRLVEKMSRMGGYPVLNPGFETSVRGLHVLGAPAAWSMGPLMRFVAGTAFAARSVTRAVAATSRRGV